MEKTAKQFLEQEGYKSYVGINGDDLFENLETLLNKYDQFRVSQQTDAQKEIEELKAENEKLKKWSDGDTVLVNLQKDEIESLKQQLTSKESDVKKAVEALEWSKQILLTSHKGFINENSESIKQIDKALSSLKSESNQSKS